MNFQKLNLFFVVLLYFRMAPEVIACDEQPDATYDNRVCFLCSFIFFCFVFFFSLFVISLFLA